ncbi:adenylosuccinate lyase [Deinococcus cellulosilyticus]|uniref:Adenylosuccinate lyase n=1 Tax=Deinococcus cellulosilyticus (strain DSM 18568 / NBRC 106333 / KACC 11606 / 5516J-15) TaxID=1223518 RepID=A0A511N4P0_DEIC1|nr:adenylosuccinate lyase [Deinococcus cellulosilyticus]GEM47361.1 adenylosuccinate lyase [Deinococcus cellulosilyticus NBRC 106333 = KACC 11606]
MIDRYLTQEMKTLWSEANRYRAWLKVELEAVGAWVELGEVPREAYEDLLSKSQTDPLDEAFAERVAEIENVTRHDIVAFTTALTERYGENARFIHLGLTSTDVVDTAQNLILDEALQIIIKDVQDLRDVCRDQAVAYKHTPCIGRTHGIHAEPMTFGLKFLNWMSALDRDLHRLEASRKQVRVVMLSGSVGTFAHVSPKVEEHVATSWGWEIAKVTNQTLSRDRIAEVLSALAIFGATLEKIAVEIRHLQRSEVREAMEPFAKGQKGSSSMPHKKNPIGCENITGMARLMRGNLQVALENIALWHERDISHSSAERVILPDTTAAATFATRRLTRILKDLVVFPERMLQNMNALGGLIFSQRVLHKLIDTGMLRETAYAIVQRNSLESWETGVPLRELLEKDSEMPLSSEQLDAAFNLDWYLREVDAIYARFGL